MSSGFLQFRRRLVDYAATFTAAFLSAIVVGTVVARHEHVAGGHPDWWRLVRIAPPLRLRAAVTGVYGDGWMSDFSSYTRYSTEGGRAGKLKVTVSWKQWAGPNRAKVTITIGTVGIGPDQQPRIGKAISVKTWTVRAHQEKSFVLQAPGPRFRVDVNVSPHFRPHDYDPANGDRRELGAVITYTFSAKKR